MSKQTIYAANLKSCFHPTFSNDKLGGKKQKIMAISYVPGNKLLYLKNGTLVTDCIGTCGCVDCSGCAKRNVCYAIDSFCQYNPCTINWIENTLQLRQDINGHYRDIQQAIIDNKIDVVRYTNSGEIESYTQFEKVVETATLFPTVEVYLYTKNYNVLYEFFDNRGLELPENMTVLISIWGNVGVKEYDHFKHHNGIKAFVVNNDEIKIDVICPAYVKNAKGKVVRLKDDRVKCGNCKLCTRSRKCKVIGCLEH